MSESSEIEKVKAALRAVMEHVQWMKDHGNVRISQTRDSVELNAFNQGRVDAAESLFAFYEDLAKQGKAELAWVLSASEMLGDGKSRPKWDGTPAEGKS